MPGVQHLLLPLQQQLLHPGKAVHPVVYAAKALATDVVALLLNFMTAGNAKKRLCCAVALLLHNKSDPQAPKNKTTLLEGQRA